MSEDVLICPKCDRVLAPGELYCPVDHNVTGGVRGVERAHLEATPRGKRHLLGVTVKDAYVINGYLGSGGFGAVYRAEQKALGRDVALKLLMLDSVNDPAVVARFKREARTAAALLDPNVVTLFDYGEANLGAGEEDRVLYFAMELVHGPTLRRVIKAEHGLSLDASLKLGVNVLRGLTAAHQLGVVHRDLKPGNVLIDESKGRPYFARLFDFGIASIQGSGGHTTQMGQGGVLGTPKYMAPEQWRAQQTAPCTDIYAFGVIMAEMLLGRPPIPKMELVDMAAAHCRDPRPEVTATTKGEAVPLALTNFIKKCMAIDPRQRYGTAREALEVLEAIDRERERAPVPEVARFSPDRDDDDLSASQASSALVTPPKRPPLPLPPPVERSEPPEAPAEEVIRVELEEPKRIWPWALAVVGLVLAFVGFRLVDVLSTRAPEPTAPVTTAPRPIDAAVKPVVDAAVVVDAVVVVPPDAAVVDAAKPDAAPLAVEPPKPNKVPGRKPNKGQPTDPKPPVIAGAPMPDVTPKANLTPDERAQAMELYRQGIEAEKRGAPKSAQRFYVRALQQGLEGEKAVDAQRRIRSIVDRTSLEASEF